MNLQSIVSGGDWALQKVGISGTKFVLNEMRGYGGNPRRPILPFGPGEALMKEMKDLVAYERSLE